MTQQSLPLQQKFGAVLRLSDARKAHPQLGRAEAEARLALAAAIIAMDEKTALCDPALCEQATVNDALTGYGDALADLLRGEAGADVEDSPLQRAHDMSRSEC